MSHYAGGTAARIGADLIEKHIDLNKPINRRLHTTAGIVTALLSSSQIRGGIRSAARGARAGAARRAAANSGGHTLRIAPPKGYKPPKIYNAPRNSYKFTEFRGKAKDGMTSKPIIQIAMEMKKHLAAKRAGKPAPVVKPLQASFQLPVKRHKPVPPAPPAGPSTVMHVHNHFGPRPKLPLKAAGTTKHPVKRPVAKTKAAGMKCKDCGAPINASMKVCPQCGSPIVMKKEMSAQSFVFKEGDNYRWVLLSSNGYRDRDGEIISTKALERDVALWELEGSPAQPLRWWHVALTKDYSRGIEVGTTDFRMMHGRTLVESGTFIDPVVGEAVFKAQDNLAASVGFRHSQNQPNSDRIFDAVSIFERSLLPKGKQSNVLVELMVN